MVNLLKQCPYCKWQGIHFKPHIRRLHIKDIRDDLEDMLAHRALKQRHKDIIELYIGDVR